MSKVETIDFSKIEGPVYTGRGRGEDLRKLLKVDQLDSAENIVNVIIPNSTYSISSSFFLGLFGPSIIKSGSKDAFFNHYHFLTNDFLKSIITAHTLRALQDKNLFSDQ